MVRWGSGGGRGEGVNFRFWVVGGELRLLPAHLEAEGNRSLSYGI